MDPTLSTQIKQLRLMQLGDSALPVGATAHSFGLESLAQLKLLTTANLAEFLEDYLGEMGALEGFFCRAAHQLAQTPAAASFGPAWLALNQQLSARKPARETRAASGMLGRRLLLLLSRLEPWPLVRQALELSQPAGAEAHYSLAFGLAGAVLALDADATVLAYLQQTLAGLVSACQRLLPLGQTDATRLVWAMKPALVAAAQRRLDPEPDGEAPACFAPLVELGSMVHPTLHTRLFMS